MKPKLYILQRFKPLEGGHYYNSFLIRALGSAEARKAAYETAGAVEEARAEDWLESAYVSCERVVDEGAEQGVLIQDYVGYK